MSSSHAEIDEAVRRFRPFFQLDYRNALKERQSRWSRRVAAPLCGSARAVPHRPRAQRQRCCAAPTRLAHARSHSSDTRSHCHSCTYRARRMRMYMLSRALGRAGGGGGTPLPTHARRWVIVPCDGSTPLSLRCDRTAPHSMRGSRSCAGACGSHDSASNAHYSRPPGATHSRQVVRPVGLAGLGRRCRVLGLGLHPAAGGGGVAKGGLRAADAAARRRVAAEHRPHRVECDAGNPLLHCGPMDGACRCNAPHGMQRFAAQRSAAFSSV